MSFRSEPRPFISRFYESHFTPEGEVALLCMCGNAFSKKPQDPQKYCSELCIRRYADIKSTAFQELLNKKTAA